MAKTEARQQFLTNVLTTAVEGGVQYWATVTEYRWENVEKPYVELYDAEWDNETDPNATPTILRVDTDDIARALGKFTRGEDGARFVEQCGDGQFKLANRTNGEEGDFDAGDADCILQIAALGEVVYG